MVDRFSDVIASYFKYVDFREKFVPLDEDYWCLSSVSTFYTKMDGAKEFAEQKKEKDKLSAVAAERREASMEQLKADGYEATYAINKMRKKTESGSPASVFLSSDRITTEYNDLIRRCLSRDTARCGAVDH